MIRGLDHRNRDVAEAILAVSVAAYRVEAAVINYPNFPPLFETVGAIRASDNHFVGFFENGTLAGVIEMTAATSPLSIQRLVVNPPCFRRGIATALLNHVLLDASLCRVGTAELNQPAICLYQRLGFERVAVKQVGTPRFLGLSSNIRCRLSINRLCDLCGVTHLCAQGRTQMRGG